MPQLTADSPQVHTRQPSLHGRTVVVSGGTTGNGRAIAALLAAEGARVLIFGRSQQHVDDALAELISVKGNVIGAVADQAAPADVRRVFEIADREFGRVDILINNAGIYAGPVEEGDDDTWRYQLHTDLDGYIDCTRQAIDRMRTQGRGHIVNIGSTSAIHHTPGHSLYVAAKSAIHGYSDALREELAPHNIKVSLIEPGMVGTRIFRSNTEEADREVQQERQRRGEMLKPEDIAVAVHYCLTQPDRCSISLIRIEPRLTE